jgi:hypothetical protein
MSWELLPIHSFGAGTRIVRARDIVEGDEPWALQRTSLIPSENLSSPAFQELFPFLTRCGLLRRAGWHIREEEA